MSDPLSIKEKILRLLKQTPGLTTSRIATELNTSRTTIIRVTRRLLHEELVSFRSAGPSKLWYLTLAAEKKVVQESLSDKTSENAQNAKRLGDTMEEFINSRRGFLSPLLLQRLQQARTALETEKTLLELRPKINENMAQISRYLQVLKSLEIDIKLKRKGYKLIYALDYSDLFRYLHPDLDRTQTDWHLFVFEQTMLHCILKAAREKKEPLVILPPSMKEFQAHLERILGDYMTLQNVEYPNIVLKSEIEDKEISEVRVDVTSSTSEKSTELSLALLTKQYRKLTERFREYSNLLERQSLQRNLVDAIEHFEGMIKNNTLSSLEKATRLKSADDVVAIQTWDKDYLNAMVVLNEIRPEKYFNNHIDAMVAVMTIRASNAMFAEHEYLVLLSSTKLIWDCLASMTFNIESAGLEETSLSILRDLDYVLLDLYFSGMEPDAALSSIRSLDTQLKRYREMLTEIEGSQVDLHYLGSQLTEVKKLIDTVWNLSPIIDPVQKDRAADMKFEDWDNGLKEIEKFIAELSDNTELLRDKVSEAISVLKENIRKLNNIFLSLGKDSEAIRQYDLDSRIR